MIKKHIFFALFTAVFTFVNAQTNTNSFYSRYHFGIPYTYGNIQNMAMGNTAIANDSWFNVNYNNPASYVNLKLTTFQTSFLIGSNWMKDNSQSLFSNTSTINNITFGLPIAKWSAISFGITPYSAVGYNYTKVYEDANFGTVQIDNAGSGGISKFFLGNAYKINIDSSFFVNIGANANYLFGQTLHEEIIYIELENSFNTWYTKTINYNDFNFNAGIQLHKKLFYNHTTQLNDSTFRTKKDSITIVVGGVYELGKDLKSSTSEFVRSFRSSSGLFSYADTTVYYNDNPTTTTLPSKLGVGINIHKVDKWQVNADFQLVNWQNTLTNDTLFSLKNAANISLGTEWIPDFAATSYFKKIKYRFGVYYNQGIIAIENEQINDYGITFGMGLPLRKTFSRINFGIIYGQRGTVNGNLIQENYINFIFGVSINDKWFKKYKYN